MTREARTSLSCALVVLVFTIAPLAGVFAWGVMSRG